MAIDNSESVEQKVLMILNKSPQFPRTLIKHLMNDKEMDDGAIRDALWRLIDQGKVQLSRERKLQATSTEHATAAD